MPLTITPDISPNATYRLRDYARGTGAGAPWLYSWDTSSIDYGLCEQTIPVATLCATERLIAVIEGAPATCFTLAVSRYASNAGGGSVGVPPSANLQVLGGQGRAASRVLNVVWSPAAWLASGEQAWIAQFSGRLCSTRWIFGDIGPAPPTIPAAIEIKALISRGSPTFPASVQVGPGVVAIP